MWQRPAGEMCTYEDLIAGMRKRGAEATEMVAALYHEQIKFNSRALTREEFVRLRIPGNWQDINSKLSHMFQRRWGGHNYGVVFCIAGPMRGKHTHRPKRWNESTKSIEKFGSAAPV